MIFTNGLLVFLMGAFLGALFGRMITFGIMALALIIMIVSTH
jgi:hypothetical protein